MKLTSYYDKRRNLRFNLGDVVHWYKYSSDRIIMDGGYGLLVDINDGSQFSFATDCWVLLDTGKLESFSPNDLDLEDFWGGDEC